MNAAVPQSGSAVPSGALVPDPVLEIRRLGKSFGGLQVTRDISLTLKAGERLGLIGPNGAGKTTLINLITGVLMPDTGTVYLNAVNLNGLSQPQRVKRGLARTFQITQLAPKITTLLQVEMAIHERNGSIGNLWRSVDAYPEVREEAMGILEMLRIESLAQRPPITLAYGEQRLVEIALAIALRPRVLLLDEPMAGVPEPERHIVLNALDRLPPELAILMIEHDMDLIFNFAHRIIVLAEGALLADGAPKQIRNHPAVRIAYLGLGSDPDQPMIAAELDPH